MARHTFQSVASNNALIDYYRREMSARSAKGRADLVEVKERNAELESQVAELKGILALKESGLERSEADLPWLVWMPTLVAKRETVDIFWPRLKKVKTFLADQDRMNPRILTLNQAVAVRDSYEALMRAGVAVPSDWVEKCRLMWSKLEAEIGQEEVVTATSSSWSSALGG
ncbi:unnamed protein product [Microthlaspi erraticum]|uniref:Uncharacterized protein n=1 Tax=Microthlaspi erraticum TaxID=1685480 RepID=A0A6D2IDY7_9BRAS|nr:unnamed protein product [Microthlaspi erraticum]